MMAVHSDNSDASYNALSRNRYYIEILEVSRQAIVLYHGTLVDDFIADKPGVLFTEVIMPVNVNAINDGNVLTFRIDYINTMKMKDRVKDKQVSDINTKSAIRDPKRIEDITDYMIAHFDQKTHGVIIVTMLLITSPMLR